MDPTTSKTAADWYRTGVEAHKRREMATARAAYREALALEPARRPTKAELQLVLDHTPLLFVTPDEPLPLEHFAAVLHPKEPWIGYHMFWRDDIDYPDDGEPVDHEVVWVRLDPAGRTPAERLAGVFSFYHGRILSAPDSVADARKNGGRPRFDVQWGKHGSLPVGWQHMEDGAVLRDMKATYERLVTHGIRKPDHPVASGWPKRFEGGWEAFTDFSVAVDPAALLRDGAMVRVGRFANAVLAAELFEFNFAAKSSVQ